MAELVEKSTCQLKEEDEIRIHLQSISSSYPYALLAGMILKVMENLTLLFLYYREKPHNDRERIEVRMQLEALE